MSAGVYLDVYDELNDEFLGTVSDAYSLSFLDDLLTPGFATFQIDITSSTDLALLTPRRWVRWRFSETAETGHVFPCVIQDRPSESVSDIELPSGENVTVVTFDCLHGLAVLGYEQGGATLWPFMGLEGRQQNPRMFGWFASDYDDSGWGPVSGDYIGGPLSTPGWPDDRAVAFQARFPGDRTLYRRELPAGTEDTGRGRMYMVASWGTSVDIWLDNEIVLQKPQNMRGIFSVDIDYEDIDHQLAIETNGGEGRMGWTWMRLVETTEADELDWQQEFFDDTEWDAPEKDGDGSISTAGWPDATAVAYDVPSESTRFRRRISGGDDGAALMTVVATQQTKITVYLDGDIILEKPAGDTGLFQEVVNFPSDLSQVSVLAEGYGRFALTWEDESDGSGSVLMNTYDPASAPGSNPWYTQRAPTNPEEFQVGNAIRRTYDPVDFPSADSNWKSYEGGPIDWLGSAYDDSTWGAPYPDGALSTSGWPDATAIAYLAPAGRSRYRRTMEAEASVTPARMTVAATIMTSVRVFLDGVEVLRKPDNRRGLFEVDIDYPDVDAQLAILVTGGGRWGWTWRELDGSGDPIGTLRRTFNPVDYPDATPWTFSTDPPPGVTSGYVMKTAIDEAHDRGDLDQVTYDFTGVVDSSSTNWELQFSRGFRLQQLGFVLDELTSLEGEPEMTPTGLLKLSSSRGSDKTATVSIDVPFSLGLTGRGPQATRWLYQTNGGLGQLIDAEAEADLGGARMETFVELGNDISPAEIGPALIKQLRRDGRVLDEYEIEMPDGVVPYIDVVLGDTVTCVGRDGSAPVRLTSFEFELLDSGDKKWISIAELVL